MPEFERGKVNSFLYLPGFSRSMVRGLGCLRKILPLNKYETIQRDKEKDGESLKIKLLLLYFSGNKLFKFDNKKHTHTGYQRIQPQ
jgi:hypothetical protein